MTFTSIAILWWSGCRGDDMWKWLETWHAQAGNYKPDPRQACAKEDVERRFAKEYGKPYQKTLRGLVRILVELGLVLRRKDDGEESLEIPDLLPLPEACLRLSNAEKSYLKVIRRENGDMVREELQSDLDALCQTGEAPEPTC